MSATQIRAEWVRAMGFVVVTGGWSMMAGFHVRDQTAWWATGLAIAVVGLIALLGAALALESARRLLGSLLGLQPATALRALVDLNRIPPAPAPNRAPRLIATVFGPLSGAAAIAFMVRLAML